MCGARRTAAALTHPPGGTPTEPAVSRLGRGGRRTGDDEAVASAATAAATAAATTAAGPAAVAGSAAVATAWRRLNGDGRDRREPGEWRLLRGGWWWSRRRDAQRRVLDPDEVRLVPPGVLPRPLVGHHLVDLAHELLPDGSTQLRTEDTGAVRLPDGSALLRTDPDRDADLLGVADHPGVRVLGRTVAVLPGTGLSGGIPPQAVDPCGADLAQRVRQVVDRRLVEDARAVGLDRLAVDHLVVDVADLPHEVRRRAQATGGHGRHAVGVIHRRDGVLPDAHLVV